jgi:site-specific DNA-methyltransferase (adenine-specific)
MLELNRIYNMDCLEGMQQMPDKCIDLVITDPPYGIGINHNMGRRKGDKPSDYQPAVWDNDSPPAEYFEEIFRISKNQVIFGANHFISKIPYDSSCWLMWDKGFSEDLSFAQFELAWTSFDSTCKKFECSSKQDDRFHPTQKPVKLFEWIIKNYAKEGDIICDPFFGSGSCLVACIRMGHQFIGFEKEKVYFDAAQIRIKKAQEQGKLQEWFELRQAGEQ